MKKIKRLIIGIIIILIIAFAALNYQNILSLFKVPTKGLEYTLNQDNSSYTVSKGKVKNLLIINIPNEYNNLPVTKIAENGFMNCTKLRKITLPNKLVSIGTSAFQSCSNLKAITIPDTVTSIGTSAFFGCSSLVSFTSPFVGGGTYETNFLGYIFGALTPIDNGAYVSKSIEKIIITSSKTNIGIGAFSFITSLKQLTICDTYGGPLSFILKGCENIEEITMPLLPTTMEQLFDGTPAKTLKAVTFNATKVEGIMAYFFKDCEGLEKVNIPADVKVIDYNAFLNCVNLISIFIPVSVILVGSHAFKNCPKLTINCEVLEKPSIWYSDWNSDNNPVNWGVSAK